MNIDGDEAAIRRAATIYAVGADLRDKSLWAQVLTGECVIEGPGFRTVGREANLATLDLLGQRFVRTQHAISNQLYSINGEIATGVTYCTAEHVRIVDGQAELLIWSLRYHDEMVRDGAAWRFASRRLELVWEDIRSLTCPGDGVASAGERRSAEDERITIAQTVYKYATALDNRDWELHRSIFTDEVEMDFESWNRIPLHRIAADDLKANIRVFFAGLDATQHSMSNPTVTIDGDRAECIVYMQAEHFLHDTAPSRRFVIGGYYTDQLIREAGGWKISAVKLTVLWQQGDRSFMDSAFERGVTRLQDA